MVTRVGKTGVVYIKKNGKKLLFFGAPPKDDNPLLTHTPHSTRPIVLGCISRGIILADPASVIRDVTMSKPP